MNSSDKTTLVVIAAIVAFFFRHSLVQALGTVAVIGSVIWLLSYVYDFLGKFFNAHNQEQ